MGKFRYVVTVETDTRVHADQVIDERTGYDEEYEDSAGKKFDYLIWYGEYPK